MDMLLYLPSGASGPVPTFLALNFYGNHSINADAAITLSSQWMRQNEQFGIVDNRATEASRGVRSSRWPVERILARDEWADPRGEFLSAWHAGPVYALLGEDPVPAEEWPPVNTPVMGTVGYHVRTGPHDVQDYDWDRYMDFADMHLR